MGAVLGALCRAAEKAQMVAAQAAANRERMSNMVDAKVPSARLAAAVSPGSSSDGPSEPGSAHGSAHASGGPSEPASPALPAHTSGGMGPGATAAVRAAWEPAIERGSGGGGGGDGDDDDGDGSLLTEGGYNGSGGSVVQGEEANPSTVRLGLVHR